MLFINYNNNVQAACEASDGTHAVYSFMELFSLFLEWIGVVISDLVKFFICIRTSTSVLPTIKANLCNQIMDKNYTTVYNQQTSNAF